MSRGLVLLCRRGSKTAAWIIWTCLHEMKSLLEITLPNKLSSGWKMDVTHSRWGSINSSTAVITPWFIREGCGWLTLPASGVVSEQTGRWKRSCVLSKCPSCLYISGWSFRPHRHSPRLTAGKNLASLQGNILSNEFLYYDHLKKIKPKKLCCNYNSLIKLPYTL